MLTLTYLIYIEKHEDGWFTTPRFYAFICTAIGAVGTVGFFLVKDVIKNIKNIRYDQSINTFNDINPCDEWDKKLQKDLAMSKNEKEKEAWIQQGAVLDKRYHCNSNRSPGVSDPS